jgi:post-segregation antitoxin (ccd killing protein)
MKAKLTVTIDEELIPRARQYARKRGLSLSKLVETSLRTATEGTTEGTSFSQRWRGKFQPAGGNDERSKALAKRYL